MRQQYLSPATPLVDGLKDNASFAVSIGVVLIIAGTMALTSPLVAGSSSAIMVGVLLVIGGVAQCLLAFKADAFGRGLLTFNMGSLMTISGSYLAMQPVAELASLTMILVILLLVAALFELIMAFQMWPAEGSGLVLINGIVTVLLGSMLWQQFPLSGAWAVSILFGVKMISSGWFLVFIGTAAKEETRTYHLFTC